MQTAERVDELGEAECLRLLSTITVGRVALTRHALPVVLPVNFALDGRSIVIRTGAGTILAAAQSAAVVAFQADELDPDLHSGWSVMMVGTLVEITEVSERLAAQRLSISSWAGGERHHYVRISAGLISGRQIGMPSKIR